jgi:hypothetical protein
MDVCMICLCVKPLLWNLDHERLRGGVEFIHIDSPLPVQGTVQVFA